MLSIAHYRIGWRSVLARRVASLTRRCTRAVLMAASLSALRVGLGHSIQTVSTLAPFAGHWHPCAHHLDHANLASLYDTHLNSYIAVLSQILSVVSGTHDPGCNSTMLCPDGCLFDLTNDEGTSLVVACPGCVFVLLLLFDCCSQ